LFRFQFLSIGWIIINLISPKKKKSL
jgi:hypothetical protein